MQLANENGFGVIDFVDITAAERVRGQSQFAPLALYVDHAHWSPVGVSRVVDALARLAPSPAQKSASVPDSSSPGSPAGKQ